MSKTEELSYVESDKDFLEKNFGKLLVISLFAVAIEFIDAGLKELAKLFKK